jgi:hypothetical protein
MRFSSERQRVGRSSSASAFRGRWQTKPETHYFAFFADFSSFVSLTFQLLLLRPSSLGRGFVFPTLTLPPLSKNCWIRASSVVGLGIFFMVFVFRFLLSVGGGGRSIPNLTAVRAKRKRSLVRLVALPWLATPIPILDGAIGQLCRTSVRGTLRQRRHQLMREPRRGDRQGAPLHLTQ